MEMIGFLVFALIILTGGAALIFMRRPWGEELIRLDKHKKKMRAKYHEDEEVNIFLTKRTNFLAQKLAQAGLEAKYDQMKVQWGVTTVVGGFVGAGISLAVLPELMVVGFIIGLVA